jgi:hypothetical protein
VKAGDERNCGSELVDTLCRLEGLHTDLAAVIDRKIECMRECDVAGMNECTASERELIGRIGEGEAHRRMLTDRLARACSLPLQKARGMNADQWAERLPPPDRANLLAVAGRLRSLTTRIARRNHVAGTLGARMLQHMDDVLSAMTAPTTGSGAYSSGGRTVGVASRQLFETVG